MFILQNKNHYLMRDKNKLNLRFSVEFYFKLFQIGKHFIRTFHFILILVIQVQ